MSDITINSSLQEVFDANIPVLTTQDLASLADLPLSTANADLTGNIGLAGFDLDNFLDDCKIASDNCEVQDYYDYDGFALTITFTDASLLNTSVYWGFCIEDKTCIIANPTFSDYDYTQLVLPTNLATNNPTEQNVEGDSSDQCATYTAGFSENCWGWNPSQPVAEGSGFAWRYQLTDDRNKWLLGDQMDVWGVINTPGSDNVKNSITLSGGMSLAATSGLTLLVAAIHQLF